MLGKIPITDLSERRQLLESIRRVIRDYAGGSNKCTFSPRHGVRLVSGPQTYDFLICFECEETKLTPVIGRSSMAIFAEAPAF